jgi:hypothetical protein
MVSASYWKIIAFPARALQRFSACEAEFFLEMRFSAPHNFVLRGPRVAT